MKSFKYYRLYITEFYRETSSRQYADLAGLKLKDKNGNDVTQLQGCVYSASDTQEGNVSNLFDGSTSTYWHSSYYNAIPAWIKVELPTAQVIASYEICPRDYYVGSYIDRPTAFKLQGSNDDYVWETLDERHDIQNGWSANTFRTFNIYNSSVVVGVSVSDGYNGGANISITVDSVEVFHAHSNDTWNRTYDNTSTSVILIDGTLDILIDEPGNTEEGKTKLLGITLTFGNDTQTLRISPDGANNSYGYSFSQSVTLISGQRKFVITTTSTGGNDASIQVEKYIDNVLVSTTPMPYQSYNGQWLEFDGLIRIGYNTVIQLYWTCQILGNIEEHTIGENISWMYSYAENLTLVEQFSVGSYLIESGGNYYAIQNDALVNLGSTLNAQLFIDYGMSTAPNFEDYSSLPAPSILCWNDTQAVELTATTIGIAQYPQTIYSEAIDLSDSSITGIDNILATYTGTPVFAVSLDETTWKAWDATNEQWITLSTDTSGMSAMALNDISTSVWSQFLHGATEFYLRFTISQATDTLESVVVTFTH